MKKVFNFFGIVLALILSLALIPTLIINPVWRGVSGLLQPEVIEDLTTQIVQEIDFSEISLDDPQLAAALAESGITPEAAQAILSSQTLAELLPLLGDDLVQVLQGSFTTTSLTEAEVLRIVEANRAELVQLLRLAAPEDTAFLTDDQLALGLDSIVQAEILPMLGEVDQLFTELQTELHGELAVALELATGPMIPTVLLVAAVVLAVLIFLFRWPQQKGFLWLGVDCILAALAVLGIALPLKGAQISQLLAQGTGLPDVFNPVLQRVANPILIGGITLVAAAVVLIAAFILLRDRRMKKAVAAQECAPVYSAPTEATAFIPAESAEAPTDESAAEEHTAEAADAPTQRSPWDNV